MTMKIFGAALIISGGALLGWIPTYYNKKRLQVLIQFKALFGDFLVELRERRGSFDLVLEKNGEITDCIKFDKPNRWLLREDHAMLMQAVQKIKNSSFQKSMESCGALIDTLDELIKSLSVGMKTTGKALPLVTGTIGFLLAVLLF